MLNVEAKAQHNNSQRNIQLIQCNLKEYALKFKHEK